LSLFFGGSFLFLFTFAVEYTGVGLDNFSFRGEVDDFIKLLILIENAFDDGIGFLVDL
jgi:hypothetical protein